MKWLLVLCLLFSFAFSQKFVNGTVGIVEVEDGEVIMRGDKTLPILTHPNNENKKIVLIAVPYAQKNDIELLSVKNGVSKKVLYKVIKGDYKEEVLTVAPSKATPPKEALERIKKERDEAYVIYKSRTPMRYWSKPFVKPMDSFITSRYGNARVFNKTVQTYHSGTDFRATVGTPIYATNDGVIALTHNDRYYAGGTIIIDHGEGIYSQYYHLSGIHVQEGQKVKRGEELGLSGATGRVTGPHLHFGIMVNGISVDPLDFIAKVESLY